MKTQPLNFEQLRQEYRKAKENKDYYLADTIKHQIRTQAKRLKLLNK